MPAKCLNPMTLFFTFWVIDKSLIYISKVCHKNACKMPQSNDCVLYLLAERLATKITTNAIFEEMTNAAKRSNLYPRLTEPCSSLAGDEM